MLNEVTNKCQNFTTVSGAHITSAHTDRVMLQTDYRRSKGKQDAYSSAQMWMSTDEAREVVRVLSLAIAETEAYQKWFYSGKPRPGDSQPSQSPQDD